MTLGEKQRKFTALVAELIRYAYSQGYELTLGEAWRPPETAAAYARAGKGIANSLHISRLAIDLNLFRNGTWLSKSEDFLPLGEWWEKQDPLCRWGGRFGDGNHFSLEHLGVK
jgi:hypothetical protein